MIECEFTDPGTEAVNPLRLPCVGAPEILRFGVERFGSEHRRAAPMFPRMSSAAASLEVADMYWLLSHGDHTGKPHIAPEFIQVALAGAVLSELTMLGFLVISEDNCVRRAHRYEGPDGVHHWVDSEIGSIAAPVLVLNWVKHLATRAAGEVVTRLRTAGLVEEHSGIRGKRSVPVDSLLTASLRVRVIHQIESPDIPAFSAHSWETRLAAYRVTTLAALLAATELDEVVAKESGRQALRGQIIAVARTYLPAPLLAIANAVRTAATQSTLTIRR
jgi:hypothetical protein